MDFESKYRKTQMNGTIYITTRQILDEELKSRLETGAGEIFIKKIPKHTAISTPEKIVELASKLGEIYALRYKIDFAGFSRGFAFLQYIDETLAEKAITCLPALFRQAYRPFTVHTSNNIKELIMRRVQVLSPVQVYLELQKVSPFAYLRVFECQPQEFLFVLGYQNNEAAAYAHKRIREVIRRFGCHAHVGWLGQKHLLSCGNAGSDCCQQLDRKMKPLHTGMWNCFTL
ncbi:hypothetical protein KR009_001421 [Drosophila setifemur]|nr:hypothetical protein KR009_001421 [Drosophila setifemur]